MDTTLEEDCLEAILARGPETSVSPGDLAADLGVDEQAAAQAVASLVEKGLCRSDDAGVTLTDEGGTVARRVARKHRVLATFFSEMLGMDSDSASREACTLEHEISDETIERLHTYIHRPVPPGKRGRRGRWCHPRPDLMDVAEDECVRVTGLRGPARHQRLMDLGILPGERICVKRKLGNSSLVVRVKGCEVAISPEIARMVFVERDA